VGEAQERATAKAAIKVLGGIFNHTETDISRRGANAQRAQAKGAMGCGLLLSRHAAETSFTKLRFASLSKIVWTLRHYGRTIGAPALL